MQRPNLMQCSSNIQETTETREDQGFFSHFKITPLNMASFFFPISFIEFTTRLLHESDFFLPFDNDMKTFTWIYHFVIARCCDIKLIFSAYFTSTTILLLHCINVFFYHGSQQICVLPTSSFCGSRTQWRNDEFGFFF